MVNAASILWPENELDTAIQHLFDKYLNKTPTNDNGILLSDECRDFIPHFFVIWENCECKMTARNDFHMHRGDSMILIFYMPSLASFIVKSVGSALAEQFDF